MLMEPLTSAVVRCSSLEEISLGSLMSIQAASLSDFGVAEWPITALGAVKFGGDWFFWIPEDSSSPSIWSKSRATAILSNGTLLEPSWDPWRDCLRAFHQMR